MKNIMPINDILYENIHDSWIDIFNKYNIIYSNKTLNDIIKLVNNKEIKDDYEKILVYPKYQDIFKCFKHFKFNQTKVVLLGQDPYHNIDQACGLCFGVINNKIPPSLKNIMKELESDLNIKLKDTSLLKWAKQGILLLNTSLSVIENKPTSHIKLWSEFTKFIIEKINEDLNNVIFVAWGSFAHSKLINIDLNKHYLIVSSHPSPLSANKKYKDFPKFIGSKPFTKINNILLNNGENIIEW